MTTIPNCEGTLHMHVYADISIGSQSSPIAYAPAHQRDSQEGLQFIDAALHIASHAEYHIDLKAPLLVTAG